MRIGTLSPRHRLVRSYLVLTSLVFLMILGCGPSQLTTSPDSSRSAGCPTESHPKTMTLHDEAYGWCVDSRDVPQGHFKVTYSNGRPKLDLPLVNGEVHGVYRAFHPSGRRAIEQGFTQGKATGLGTYWPPNGPPQRCDASACAETSLTLGRPFCRPEEISKTLAGLQGSLNQCAGATHPRDAKAAHITAQWWIGLLGFPYAIQVRSSEVDRSAAQCIEGIIKETRFAAPFGEACSVRMPFTLNAE